MDVNKLSQGQKILGLAGVLLLVDLWFSWYSVKIPTGLNVGDLDTSASAWQAFDWTDILLAITALAAIGAVAIVVTNAKVSLPVDLTTIATGLGAVMTLIVLYRIINQPGPNNLINVEWGAYLGLVLVAAVAYGGMRAGSDAPAASPPAV